MSQKLIMTIETRPIFFGIFILEQAFKTFLLDFSLVGCYVVVFFFFQSMVVEFKNYLLAAIKKNAIKR